MLKVRDLMSEYRHLFTERALETMAIPLKSTVTETTRALNACFVAHDADEAEKAARVLVAFCNQLEGQGLLMGTLAGLSTMSVSHDQVAVFLFPHVPTVAIEGLRQEYGFLVEEGQLGPRWNDWHAAVGTMEHKIGRLVKALETGNYFGQPMDLIQESPLLLSDMSLRCFDVVGLVPPSCECGGQTAGYQPYAAGHASYCPLKVKG